MSFTKGILMPPAPATTRGASTKLGFDPKGERIIYCNLRSVFLLSLSGAQPNVSYAGHVKETTVAKISPSGYYAASADITGAVRVWDLAGDEQILKNEVKALGGRINDLAWDSESRRIIVGGDGRDRFAHAFAFDTGSSVGELSGHSKVINAVAIRQQRPFRAVTGGDDRTLVFSHGVPYKYAKVLADHTGFVQDVAFGPSGQNFVSVGADGKVLLYDGSTGDYISSLSTPEASGHKGTIFSVSWAQTSSQFCTSGADRTVKLWDVETQKPAQTWSLGDDLAAQQVGSAWSPAQTHEIVSIAYDGTINIFDTRQGAKPARQLYGHQKSVTAMSSRPATGSTFFTGSYDGKVHSYDLEKKTCVPVEGAGHTNSIVAIACDAKGKSYTAGMDDTIREVGGSGGTFAFSSSSISTDGQPKAFCLDTLGKRIYAAGQSIKIADGNSQQAVIAAQSEVMSLAVSPSGALAAGQSDGKIQFYDLAGLKPQEPRDFSKNRGAVTALSFSPDGNYLAAGDSNGKIIVYSMPTGEVKTSAWAFHSAKIMSISWSPSSTRAVSSSLDTNVYVWNIVKPTRNIALKNIHPGGASGATFVDEDSIVTTGSDATIRTWEIKHHAV